MDEQYQHIINTYQNGYYIYSFVINFKLNSCYDDLHPSKAHKQFKETFEKYFKQHRTIKYICFAELSPQGKYHIHGIIFDKTADYDEHDKRLRNIRNRFRRLYGWNGFQRIYSLTDPYKTTDLRFANKTFSTTFLKIWTYITKQIKWYSFLKPFGAL